MTSPMKTHVLLARAALTILAALASGAHAAPVVITPGSVAGYSFTSPASSSGGGSSSGPVETLDMCRVTPALSSRTLSMASRNWYGYNKPITVYYKMVGGGGGAVVGDATGPQFISAGGSSAILKNGALIAVAPGQSAAAAAAKAAPVVVSGSFTVSPTDTLTFINGGGAGVSGIGATSYGGPGPSYYYRVYPGGGGAGYYGGGVGSSYDGYGMPVAGAAYATGGTGTAGGTGAFSGSLYTGASSGPVTGGNGASSGASWSVDKYSPGSITSGGGGGQGRTGDAGGSSQGYLPNKCPAQAPGAQSYAPTSTTFDLHPSAGIAGGSLFNGSEFGVNYSCAAGGGFGQIVIQYQALTCDVIPQYDQP